MLFSADPTQPMSSLLLIIYEFDPQPVCRAAEARLDRRADSDAGGAEPQHFARVIASSRSASR